MSMVKTVEMVHELQNTAGIFGRSNEVKVIFEGSQACTDGEQIVLPAMIQNADVSGEIQKVMRGYLDHEAGHIRHTDFKVWKGNVKKISGNTKALWNCLEDIYLEDRVMEEYPGSLKNFRELTSFTGEKELDFVKGNPTFSDINIESACLGITTVGRKDYGARHNKELTEVLNDRMRKWSERWTELAKKSEGTAQTLRLAKRISKLLKEDPKLESSPDEFNPDLDGDEGIESFEDWEHEGAKPLGEKGEQSGKTGVKIVDKQNKIAEDIFGGSGVTPENPGNKRKQYKVLTTRFDKVVHKDDPSSGLWVHERMQKTSSTEYDSLRSEVSSQVLVMKSKLRRALSSKEQRDWDFGRERGSIDPKRLVSAFNGATNVYRRRMDRDELDTAVHLLVDLSGSMSGRKMQTAALSAIAFAECFEGTSINYQISGFSNSNVGDAYRIMQELDCEARRRGDNIYARAESLNIYKFKSFNDKLFNVRGSVASLYEVAGGNNSDQCALMWAYDELKKQRQKRKILLVFSDGSPAVNTIGNPDLYGMLEDAVKLVESKGVECIGIGIHHDVSNLYKNNAQVDNLDDLSGVMFNKLTNILVRGK